jgi:hypothetical protein
VAMGTRGGLVYGQVEHHGVGSDGLGDRPGHAPALHHCQSSPAKVSSAEGVGGLPVLSEGTGYPSPDVGGDSGWAGGGLAFSFSSPSPGPCGVGGSLGLSSFPLIQPGAPSGRRFRGFPQCNLSPLFIQPFPTFGWPGGGEPRSSWGHQRGGGYGGSGDSDDSDDSGDSDGGSSGDGSSREGGSGDSGETMGRQDEVYNCCYGGSWGGNSGDGGSGEGDSGDSGETMGRLEEFYSNGGTGGECVARVLKI